LEAQGDDDEIIVLGIDTVPKLWQRGLLTKLEDLNWIYHTMVFTARSLSKVDTAFQSRCLGHRLESRFKEKNSKSMSSTDYDVEMENVPLGIWNIKEEDAIGDFIRDLLLFKAMEPVEFVKYALDELPYVDLLSMEKIISSACTITEKSTWSDLEWWVFEVKKEISGCKPKSFLAGKPSVAVVVHPPAPSFLNLLKDF